MYGKFRGWGLTNVTTPQGWPYRFWHGGGPKGGDKGPMGGDWRVNRDKIWRGHK